MFKSARPITLAAGLTLRQNEGGEGGGGGRLTPAQRRQVRRTCPGASPTPALLRSASCSKAASPVAPAVKRDGGCFYRGKFVLYPVV